jgi:hypothetical protein
MPASLMLFGSAKEGAHVPEQGDARRREAIIRSARGAGWTALRLGAGFTPVRNSKPPSPCKPICSARSRYVGDRGNRTIRARPHHCHRAKAKFEADNLELRLAVLATIQLRHELYPARFPRRAINAPPQGEFLLSGKSGNRDGKVWGGRRSRSIGAVSIDSEACSEIGAGRYRWDSSGHPGHRRQRRFRRVRDIARRGIRAHRNNPVVRTDLAGASSHWDSTCRPVHSGPNPGRTADDVGGNRTGRVQPAARPIPGMGRLWRLGQPMPIR